MKSLSQFLVASIVALACAAINALARAAEVEILTEWEVSEKLTIQEIQPGIWIHTSWQELANGFDFPANGLIVRHGDELILIDTAWGPDITEELLDWIETEIELPVTTTIVSHFHDDSMGGTPVLEARDVPFIGGPLTRSNGAGEHIPLPKVISGLTGGKAVTIGNVEVFHPGAAHSSDNLVVWVPAARVLFGSCAVRSPVFSGLGNTADSDLEGWPEAIGRVRDRYPDVKVVVPGHGPAGDASLLSHTIDLFAD